MVNKFSIEDTFIKQKKYFHSHQTQSVETRKRYLLRFRDILISNKKNIYKALSDDLGKAPEVIDLAEIGAVIDEIDILVAGLNEWSGDQSIEITGFLSPSQGLIRPTPYGVCYIIGPFNYPVNLTLTPLIGALAAGNTAILKPSELTPKTATVIQHLIEEAFPSEYVSVILGGREENEILLSLPFDFIFFTGSQKVGKVVMTAAAKHLTPVVLELGGKCPVIITEDADLDNVVERVSYAKFLNSGQTCVAPDYLLVDQKLHPALIEKFTQHLSEKYDTLDANGKIVSHAQTLKLAQYLDNTRGHILFGGDYSAEDRLLKPTLVDNVNWDDALMQQEIFGPILPILTYDNIDVAIENINHYHPKPLAAYVFSTNLDKAHILINHIQSGDAQINDVLTHALCGQLPFGGIGPSGMGKYHGKESFFTFSHKKSIRIA
jgi:aldehyde dehydrogenase (NAD+)